MLDESNEFGTDTPEQSTAGSGGRTFAIVGGILGALILLTLVVGAAYVLWLGPRLTAQRNVAQATVEAENALVAQQMTSTALVLLWTPTTEPSTTPSPTYTFTRTRTSTNTVTPQTLTASSTPVVAVNTLTETSTPNSATLAAEQTQVWEQMTSTVSTVSASATATTSATATSSKMPTTGFFDEGGLPALSALALLLVTVIILARRLRRLPIQ